MRIEEKILKGKSVLPGDTEKEKNQYRLSHIFVGTLLMFLLPVVIFFLSGRHMGMLYAGTFIAAAAVGLLVGFWAGCVPVVTNAVILIATTGKPLVYLLLGRSGSYGSREFLVRLASWAFLALLIFAFSYAGAKAREMRRKRKG